MPSTSPARRTTPRPVARPERYGGGATDISSDALPQPQLRFTEARTPSTKRGSISASLTLPRIALEVGEPAVDELAEHGRRGRELGRAEPGADRGEPAARASARQLARLHAVIAQRASARPATARRRGARRRRPRARARCGCGRRGSGRGSGAWPIATTSTPRPSTSAIRKVSPVRSSPARRRSAADSNGRRPGVGGSSAARENSGRGEHSPATSSFAGRARGQRARRERVREPRELASSPCSRRGTAATARSCASASLCACRCRRARSSRDRATASRSRTARRAGRPRPGPASRVRRRAPC